MRNGCWLLLLCRSDAVVPNTSSVMSGGGSDSTSLLSEESTSTERNSMFFKLFLHQIFSDVVSYISEYGVLKYVIELNILQFYQLINEYDIVLVAKLGNLMDFLIIIQCI